MNILSEDEKPPFEVVNAHGSSPLVLVCEHASNAIPRRLKNLGLSEDVINAHVAWDIGAVEMARYLSAQFEAPLVVSRISRLVYDCNRPPYVSQTIPEKSERFIIPGNCHVSMAHKQARMDEIYTPFSEAIKTTLNTTLKAQGRAVLLTIHSFSPFYHDQQRSVELGVLHSRDCRLSDKLFDKLHLVGNLKVAQNQPYGPEDGVDHTIEVHGAANGFLNAMIEIRNDLLVASGGVEKMGRMLALAIRQSLSDLQIDV